MTKNPQDPGDGRPPGEAREIAFDCKFFLGDRPCVWHKAEGVLCTCDHYQRIEQRVLIIKLDAMGDVLRTTALLPSLDKAHPGAAITWITRRESVALLQRNPLLTEVFEYGEDALVQLQTRAFDRVINLDAGKTSAGPFAFGVGRAMIRSGFAVEYRIFTKGIYAVDEDRARMERRGIWKDWPQ